jgi:hypothetical protein
MSINIEVEDNLKAAITDDTAKIPVIPDPQIGMTGDKISCQYER